MLRAARFDGPGDARGRRRPTTDVTKRHRAEDAGGDAGGAARRGRRGGRLRPTPTGSSRHWNRGAERLHGWTLAEAVGKNALELISPARRQREAERVRRQSSRVRANDEAELDRSAQGRLDLPGLRARPRCRRAMGSPRAGSRSWSTSPSAWPRSVRCVAARNFMRAIADSMGEGLFTLDPEGRLMLHQRRRRRRCSAGRPRSSQGRVMHDVIHSTRPDGSDPASRTAR